MTTKPLNRRAYGSIAHLSASQKGEHDYFISQGQEGILTKKTRDKHDLIIVQEKLDGTCVAVTRVDDQLTPINRAGYSLIGHQSEQYCFFNHWFNLNQKKFEFLQENERCVGEFLALAHGTLYNLDKCEPFFMFDVFTANNERKTFDELSKIAYQNNLQQPPLFWRENEALKLEAAISKLKRKIDDLLSDPSEGLVYRCERKGKVDFLAKWVRPSFIAGKYFDNQTGQPPVWNWRPY